MERISTRSNGETVSRFAIPSTSARDILTRWNSPGGSMRTSPGRAPVSSASIASRSGASVFSGAGRAGSLAGAGPSTGGCTQPAAKRQSASASRTQSHRFIKSPLAVFYGGQPRAVAVRIFKINIGFRESPRPDDVKIITSKIGQRFGSVVRVVEGTDVKTDLVIIVHCGPYKRLCAK